MLSAIRRAWRSYLDSLPRSEEPAPVSDAAIRREMSPPHPAEVRQAFAALAGIATGHLPQEAAVKAAAALSARLKPGTTPSEAMARWIGANNGPKSRNLGVMCVDWKAREEIQWQAERIAKAHRIELDWHYDFRADRSWEGWEERGETPVSAPLRALADALRRQGLALIVLANDDTVCAFAVRVEHEVEVLALADRLGLAVERAVSSAGRA
jgi:hypothetical protein